MKTAKEILGKNANALQQRSWTSTTPTGDNQNQRPSIDQTTSNTSASEISQTTKSLINMVFTRFMAIYGHKFKSSFETETEMRIAKREWAMSLANYSEGELVAGVSISKETLAWAPSISEFIQILQNLNGAFGLPDVRIAYKEACFHSRSPSEYNWSHPAVYHAGRETGWFELGSEPEKQVFPQFSYHYEIMCRRFRQGETFEQPIAVAIENKQTTSLFIFIDQWSKDQNLSPEEGSSLLYYMTKPKGTKARENFKVKSQAKVEEMGKDIQLPE